MHVLLQGTALLQAVVEAEERHDLHQAKHKRASHFAELHRIQNSMKSELRQATSCVAATHMHYVCMHPLKVMLCVRTCRGSASAPSTVAVRRPLGALSARAASSPTALPPPPHTSLEGGCATRWHACAAPSRPSSHMEHRRTASALLTSAARIFSSPSVVASSARRHTLPAMSDSAR
jgi:hypothetical protein